MRGIQVSVSGITFVHWPVRKEYKASQSVLNERYVFAPSVRPSVPLLRYLRKFFKFCHKHSLGVEDELIIFWRSKVKIDLTLVNVIFVMYGSALGPNVKSFFRFFSEF